MKLKALRLSNVGVFREPVVIDGFSGGLDVLVGGNEFGKSTIFRALEAVFLKKYSGSGTDIKRLASGGSGFPLVEADFEINMRLWRITKKFGRSGKAELGEVKHGVGFRGDDAEVELRRLLGFEADGAPGNFDLLWVGQKGGLEAPGFDEGKSKNKKGARGAPEMILEAIDAEVSQVATGPVARSVAVRVEKMLGELVTGRGARKHGRLANAEQHLRTLEEQLGYAVRIVRDTEALVQELGTLRGEGGALFDPQKREARDARLKELRETIANARRLGEREKTVIAQRDGARSSFLKVQSDLAAFDRDLNALTGLGEGMAQDKVRLEKMREELETAGQEAKSARAAADDLRAREARLVVAQQRRDGLSKRAQVEDVLAKRRQGLDAVRETAERIDELGGLLRANPAEDAICERFFALERDIELLERQMDAASPTVHVAYEKNAAGRIRQGREPVADKARVTVREATTFAIDGIGALKVVPGSVDDRRGQEDKLAGLREEAMKVLAHCGVNDGAGLRALYRVRRDLTAELSAAKARLDGLAPEGTPVLEASVRELEVSLREFDRLPAADETIDAKADVEQELARVRQAVEDANRVAQARVADHDQRKSQTDILAAKLGERVAQHRDLEQLLGGADVRALKREDLAHKLDEARVAQTSAEQSVLGLAKPDETPDVGALEEELLRAEQDAKASEHRGRELQKKIAHLEGQIHAAEEGGAGLNLARLEGEVERARAEVASVLLDVEALRLLHETLEGAMAQSRDDVVAPVLRRLQPYLNVVLPGAEMVFGDDFRLEGLRRADDVEAIGWLSAGTVEQLAVIVRLAYARLLADAGTPMPFILDDPLAYSDDGRLVKTFECLKQAAQVHQVIVLSCREQSFNALGGARLDVGPWDGAPTN